MIPTEYLRQVPIKHYVYGKENGLFITGYKVQMAWFCEYLTKEQRFSESEKVALEHGDEVEAFEWIDIPVKVNP